MRNNFELESIIKKLDNENDINIIKKWIIDIQHKAHELVISNESYNIKSFILLFFLFGFISWVWEVSLFFVQTGELVNKGTLIGPWLPIYGVGGVITLSICSNPKIKKNFFLTFCFISILCSILEYFTSVYLEDIYGLRWWDYSNYFWNIDGRICLLASVFFGLIGSFGLYVIAPNLNKKIDMIPSKIQTILCTILILAFLFDFGYCLNNPNSGDGITFTLIDNKYFISIKK